MMQSDAQLDVLDALQSVAESAGKLAAAARRADQSGVAGELDARGGELADGIAELEAADRWAGDAAAEVARAEEAARDLEHARREVDSGAADAVPWSEVVAAVVAALEVVGRLRPREGGRSRSK